MSSDNRQVKIAKCKCGKCVALVSVMPHAEIDADTSKEFRDFAKNGHTIKIVPLSIFKKMKFMDCAKCYPKNEDLLENEEQTCMYCGKKCTSKDGTWPQVVRISATEQEDMMDADLNNREKEEFVCYDCCD